MGLENNDGCLVHRRIIIGLSVALTATIIYFSTRTGDVVKESKNEEKSALENMLGPDHPFNKVIK